MNVFCLIVKAIVAVMIVMGDAIKIMMRESMCNNIIKIMFVMASFSLVTACDNRINMSEGEELGGVQITENASQEIRKLTDDVWANAVANAPASLRLQEGLPIDEFSDLSLDQYRRGLAQIAKFRKRLATIDSSQLTGSDLTTYEILDFEFKDTGANDDDFWLTFDLTVYVAPYYFQDALQAFAVQVITDKVSADHYLKLVNKFGDMIDQLRDKTIGQIERGIYMPKQVLPSTRVIWQGLQAALPASIKVADARLQGLTDVEIKAFNTELENLIEARVIKGFDQILNLIGDDYEIKAPETVGLGQYVGGLDVYKRRVRIATTLELTPEEIHERGKKAVAEIAARMKGIRDGLGFKGTAREFHDQLKKDPRFIAKTPEDVEKRYMDYINRIEPLLGEYFKRQPKAEYGIKRLPLAAEAGMTFGYYGVPTAAVPVGYYYYNGSDLANRSLITAGSLIYHELLPGHHFHLAIQGENKALQKYRQKYSVGAYTEGWAEYAASLGIEMGMYQTPHDLYGRYIMEIFLASRLVVDTGMNAFGWPLEDARAYMTEHLYQSDVEIASETLRYSTSLPGQALGYRIGYEKLWELRRRAEAALGETFDVRDYHDVVLSEGARPLVALEVEVNRYITETIKNKEP